ncbi:glycosyltransferase family 4 protein [Shewanella sp. HL-SH4]|uniref:glycosyltransferase family 4 protein n=1 Tax=Shewanella sp. HL-SH4 TaxID=3436240 RepID=UPI003EB7826C
MNNRVTLICESFLPERTAGSNRALSIINTLLLSDYQVTVCFLMPLGCASQDYIFPNELKCFTNLKLIPVTRKIYNKSNLLFRLMNETMQAKKLISKSLEVDSDTIIISTPMLMLLPVAAWYLKNAKVHTILEVRDLIWRYYEFKTGLLSYLISEVLTKISIYSINKFDDVVTVTHSQREWLVSKTKTNVIAIENGIDLNTLQKLSTVNKGALLDDSIIYAGSIGYPQNISTLVEAVYLLQNKGVIIRLTIVGNGPEFDKVSELIEKRKLLNARVIPAVKFEQLSEEYSNHKILYGQLRNIPSLETAVPTKVFEYLAMSKPIIFGLKGEAKDILLKFEGVVVVEPDKPQELAEAILKQISNNVFKGNNYNQLHSNYLRENLISKYKDLIC